MQKGDAQKFSQDGGLLSVQTAAQVRRVSNSSSSLPYSPDGNMTPLHFRIADSIRKLGQEESKEDEAFQKGIDQARSDLQLHNPRNKKSTWSQFYTQNINSSMLASSEQLSNNQARISQIKYDKQTSLLIQHQNNSKSSLVASLNNPNSELLPLNQISLEEESKSESSANGKSVARDQQQVEQHQDSQIVTEARADLINESQEVPIFVEEVKEQLPNGSQEEYERRAQNFSFANPFLGILQEHHGLSTMNYKSKNYGTQPNQRKNKQRSQTRDQSNNPIQLEAQHQNEDHLFQESVHNQPDNNNNNINNIESGNSSDSLVQIQNSQNQPEVLNKPFVKQFFSDFRRYLVSVLQKVPLKTGSSNENQNSTKVAEKAQVEIILATHQSQAPVEETVLQEQRLTTLQNIQSPSNTSNLDFQLGSLNQIQGRQAGDNCCLDQQLEIVSNNPLQLSSLDNDQINQIPYFNQLDNANKSDEEKACSVKIQDKASPKESMPVVQPIDKERASTRFDENLVRVSDALDLIAFGLLMCTLTSRSFYRDYKYAQDMETLFERYVGYAAITHQLISSLRLRIFTYFLFYCTLQIPWDTDVGFVQRYTHILATTLFYYLIGFQNNIGKIEREVKTLQKMDILEKNENNLKQLMQLIPYGIAVVNLDNVANYNKSFAKTIGIGRRKNQILEALQKFQRKLKPKEVVKQAKEVPTKTETSKFGPMSQSQKQSRLAISPTLTSLFDDLATIQKNRESYFKDSKHKFDIYFVEKEEWVSPQKSKEGRGQKTPKPVPDLKSKKNSRFDQEKNQESNFSTNHAQQARKIYSISISPIVWLDKECFLITVKDITHEKVINQKEIMDKLRNMIFKSFSHELKTPLNGIIMSVDTSKFISKQLMSKIKKERKRGNLQLDDAFQQSKQLKIQINVMESCSYVLKNIMHDFFDYNQLQTNELSLNIKEFDLNLFVKDIKRIVKQQIKFDHIKFKCSVDLQPLLFDRQTNATSPDFFTKQQANTPAAVSKENEKKVIKMSADKERLQQILLNLLMNSIKFTNKGVIELNVYVNTLATPPSVIFRVKDSGIGIEEERLPYIFNLFEKDENSNLTEYLNLTTKSARMGLPISQNLCQLMGGTIRVRSKLGEGSAFHFRLPLSAEDDNMKEIEIQNQKINSILEQAKQDSQKQLLPQRKRMNIPQFTLPLSSQGETARQVMTIKDKRSQAQDGSVISANSPIIENESAHSLTANLLMQHSNREQHSYKRQKAILVSRPHTNKQLFEFPSELEVLGNVTSKDFVQSNSKQLLWVSSVNNQSFINRSLKQINISNTSVQVSRDQARFTSPQIQQTKNDFLQLKEEEKGEQRISDDDEYCCKIEDDDEEEREEDYNSLLSEEEREDINSDEDYEDMDEQIQEEDEGEQSEDAVRQVELEERSINIQRNNPIRQRKQAGFVYHVQKKVGQFEFVFSSARGRSNSRIGSGREGIHEDEHLPPQVRSSTEHLEEILAFEQMKRSQGFRTSQFNQDKQRRKSIVPIPQITMVTFTSQVEKMERDRLDMEKLKEMRELDSVSSKKSFTSNESEHKPKDVGKLEQVKTQKPFERRKTITIGRVSQSQNTFEEMMKLVYQVDKQPNKKLWSKHVMPSLNASKMLSQKGSRRSSTSNQHSQKTAQFQSKVQLMRQASIRHIVVKNKMSEDDSQVKAFTESIRNNNAGNLQRKEELLNTENQSAVFQTLVQNQLNSGIEPSAYLNVKTFSNEQSLSQNNLTVTGEHFHIQKAGSSFKRMSATYSRGDSNQTQLQNQGKYDLLDSSRNRNSRDLSLIHNLVDPPESRPPSLNWKDAPEESKTDSNNGFRSRNKSMISYQEGTPNSLMNANQLSDQLNQSALPDRLQKQQSHFSKNQAQMRRQIKIPYLTTYKNKDYLEIASQINNSIAGMDRTISPNSATLKPVKEDILGTPLMHLNSNPHQQFNYHSYASNQPIQPGLSTEILMKQNEDSRSPSGRQSNYMKQKAADPDSEHLSLNYLAPPPNQQLSESKNSSLRKIDSRTFNAKSQKRLTGMEKRMNFLGKTGIGKSNRSLIAMKIAQHPQFQQHSQFYASKRPNSIKNFSGSSFSNQLHNQNDHSNHEGPYALQPNILSKTQKSQAHLLKFNKNELRPFHSFARQTPEKDKQSQQSSISKNLSLANNSSSRASSIKRHKDLNDSSGYIQDINKGRKRNLNDQDQSQKFESKNINLSRIVAQSSPVNSSPSTLRHKERVPRASIDSPDINQLKKQAMIKNSTKSLIENLSKQQDRMNEELDHRKNLFRQKVISEEIKEVNQQMIEQGQNTPDKYQIQINFEQMSPRRKSEEMIQAFEEDMDDELLLLESDRPSDLQYQPNARKITNNVGRYLFNSPTSDQRRGRNRIEKESVFPTEQIEKWDSSQMFPQNRQRRFHHISQQYPHNSHLNNSDQEEVKVGGSQLFEKINVIVNENQPLSQGESLFQVYQQINDQSVNVSDFRIRSDNVQAPEGPLNIIHMQYSLTKPIQESTLSPRDTNYNFKTLRDDHSGLDIQARSELSQRSEEHQANNNSQGQSPKQDNYSFSINNNQLISQSHYGIKKKLQLTIQSNTLNHDLDSSYKQSSDSIILGSKASFSALPKHKDTEKLDFHIQKSNSPYSCTKKPSTFTFQPLEIQKAPQNFLNIPVIETAQQNSNHSFLSPMKLQNQLYNLRRKILAENSKQGDQLQNNSRQEYNEIQPFDEESKHAQLGYQIQEESSNTIQQQLRQSLQERRKQRASQINDQSNLEKSSQEGEHTIQSYQNLIKNSSGMSQSPNIMLHLKSQSEISSGLIKQYQQESIIEFNGEVQEAPKIKRNNQMGQTKLFLQLQSNGNSESQSNSDSDNDSISKQIVENSQHECPSILVVDDVQMNRYAVEQMLSLIFNLKILQAENGQQAIDILVNYYSNKACSCKGIKLILMDIEMPVMDGITATRHIKQMMATTPQDLQIYHNQQHKNQQKANQILNLQKNLLPHDIHIVALTAYMDEKHNCLQAGMSDFMTKPTSKAELEEILTKHNLI